MRRCYRTKLISQWKFAAVSCRKILAFAFKPHCVAQPSEHSTTSEDTELISEFSVIVERLLIEIYWIEKSGSFQKSMLWHRSDECNVDCVVWQGNRIKSHLLFKRPFLRLSMDWNDTFLILLWDREERITLITSPMMRVAPDSNRNETFFSNRPEATVNLEELKVN